MTSRQLGWGPIDFGRTFFWLIFEVHLLDHRLPQQANQTRISGCSVQRKSRAFLKLICWKRFCCTGYSVFQLSRMASSRAPAAKGGGDRDRCSLHAFAKTIVASHFLRSRGMRHGQFVSPAISFSSGSMSYQVSAFEAARGIFVHRGSPLFCHRGICTLVHSSSSSIPFTLQPGEYAIIFSSGLEQFCSIYRGSLQVVCLSVAGRIARGSGSSWFFRMPWALIQPSPACRDVSCPRSAAGRPSNEPGLRRLLPAVACAAW